MGRHIAPGPVDRGRLRVESTMMAALVWVWPVYEYLTDRSGSDELKVARN